MDLPAIEPIDRLLAAALMALGFFALLTGFWIHAAGAKIARLESRLNALNDLLSQR